VRHSWLVLNPGPRKDGNTSNAGSQGPGRKEISLASGICPWNADFLQGTTYNDKGGKPFGASGGGLEYCIPDVLSCGDVSMFTKPVCNTPPYGIPPSVASPGDPSPTACCRPGLFCCSRFHIATSRTLVSAD
jgi:hypothetical protein